MLERLLDVPNLSIRALVRNKQKGEKLKQFGVTPVIGDLDSLEIIKQEASDADVVLTMVRLPFEVD